MIRRKMMTVPTVERREREEDTNVAHHQMKRNTKQNRHKTVNLPVNLQHSSQCMMHMTLMMPTGHNTTLALVTGKVNRLTQKTN